MHLDRVVRFRLRTVAGLDHLHEAPWVMTGPLVVLGVLMGGIACAMLLVGGLVALQQAAVLGSVSQQVAHHAPCPVLIVRACKNELCNVRNSINPAVISIAM